MTPPTGVRSCGGGPAPEKDGAVDAEALEAPESIEEGHQQRDQPRPAGTRATLQPMTLLGIQNGLN